MTKNKDSVLFTVNITVRLLVICLVVAALVALVFTVTKEPIAKGELARKEEAIRTIFPEVASFNEDAFIEGEGINVVYTVKNADGREIGWCVDYTGSSDFGGDVNMMIGIGTNGRVVTVQILSHSETYIDRYLDETGRYNGSDLQAGATMSYNAIRNAITAVEAIFLPDGNAAPETAEPEPEQSLYTEQDMQQLFANGVAFVQQNAISNANVNAVFAAIDSAGQVIGHCVAYTSHEGYRGDIELLMARTPEGRVTGVKVLHSYDEAMAFHVQSDGMYMPDTTAGATTRNAVENAILAVEALRLGGDAI